MRISLLSQKDQERAELEAAMRRLEESAGAVTETPIMVGRDDLLLRGYLRGYEHAGNSDRAKAAEMRERPGYMRNLSAFRKKTR